MKTFQFTARLVTDAVISERSATTGGHRCLDYIPGACLLGAVAAELYDGLEQDAFTVFHSGKVRFGNAYPLSTTGEPALPVPFAWHTTKGEEMNGSVANVKNLLCATAAQHEEWEKKGDQQKQLRSGYFTLSGKLLQPAKRYRLKTAINRRKMGMAEESQLYGYESLQAGSLWHFSVEFDDEVSEAVRQQVLSALGGTLRIGRSRTAEYGVLQTALCSAAIEPLPSASQSDGRLVIYCLSDLALTDEKGMPTLVPDFGLSAVTFDPAKSFLRIRSYAPFNGTRWRFDLERQVIAKGSILVYGGNPTSEDLQSLQDRIAKGIGLYRQEGLGKLLINPSFLAQFGFTASAIVRLPVAEPPVLSAANTPLSQWLLARASTQEQACKTIEQVEKWVDDLVSGPCPKNSQWGQLRNIAFLKTIDEIRKGIKQLCTEGVSQKQWSKPVKVDGKKTDYGKFLAEVVLAEGVSLEAARQRLYHLGNRIPRRSNQKEQRGDA
jgi:CRISPR-associated protein Csx10